MGEAELRECPFCGGEAEIKEFHRKMFIGACTACGVKFPNASQTKEEATEKWNKRHEPPTPGGAIVPAENERLGG